MHSPIKAIADSLQNTGDIGTQEVFETDLDSLKDTAYTSEDSVVTLCDNFVTIYSFPTWKKKFAK